MPQVQPAMKRLSRELLSIKRDLKNHINETIYLQPTNVSKSLLGWTALLKGPQDTPYEGGVFQLSISCNNQYPLRPPSMVFITKIFHPNINFHTGEICLDILKQEWSPAWGLQAACRAVLALMSDWDAESPLNCDAGNMIRGGDIVCFRGTARMYTIENAMCLSWPGDEIVNKKSEQNERIKKRY